MKYYKTDNLKISFREYYNIASGPGFLFAWICKILRISLKLPGGIPEPQPFRDKVTEAENIPPQILVKLRSGISDFQQLGFDQFWYYTIKNSLMGGVSYGVQAMHSSRQTAGKIIFASFGSRESYVHVLVSELSDGTFLGTTNHRPPFKTPPGYYCLHKLRANAAQLWSLHQKKLAEFNSHNPPNNGVTSRKWRRWKTRPHEYLMRTKFHAEFGWK